MKNKYLVVLTGPTAVGKTDLSIKIAQYYNTEIISADSRQMYKELNIGTAKPDNKTLQKIKHYFINNISIFDYYNASIYEYEVLELLSKLFDKHDIVLMTGGSMLYIDAVCYGIDDIPTIEPEIRKYVHEKFEKYGIEGLRRELKLIDPEYYKIVDLKNPKRLMKAIEVFAQTGKKYSSLRTNSRKKRDFEIIKIVLNTEREKLHKKINIRVDIMIDKGLIDEAKKLYEHKHLNSLDTVGYKELFAFFDGQYDLNTAIKLIKRNTRRYARKQISWFRKYDDASWFEPNEYQNIIKYIENKINKK